MRLVSLVWFVGCAELLDIPDSPRLVVVPDASTPVAHTEPTPASEALPRPLSGTNAPPPEAATKPSLDNTAENDTDGQSIENRGSDAGASVPDAGVGAPVPDASVPPIDDPPPIPGCAESALVGPNGRCFVAASTRLSWADARLACQSRGTGWDLASIPNDAVNQFMSTSSPGEAWIGASDAADEGL